MEQHVVWSNSCPAFDNQSDQRIYCCLSNVAGAAAQQIDQCWFVCRARDLAVVADIWFDRTDQLVLSDGKRLGHDRLAKCARYRKWSFDRHTGWGRAANARECVWNHDGHFVARGFRSESPVAAPHDDRSAG